MIPKVISYHAVVVLVLDFSNFFSHPVNNIRFSKMVITFISRWKGEFGLFSSLYSMTSNGECWHPLSLLLHTLKVSKKLSAVLALLLTSLILSQIQSTNLLLSSKIMWQNLSWVTSMREILRLDSEKLSQSKRSRNEKRGLCVDFLRLEFSTDQ